MLNGYQVLEITDVQFAYHSEHESVLNDVNIGIRQGDFVGIIGPNGSGKTTLLKLITRTLQIQKGRVKILGKDLVDLSQKDLARIVGVVPQRFDIQFDYSAYDVVSMGLYPHLSRFRNQTDEDRNVIRKAMELTNICHLKDRSVLQMSGGEMQRTMIAQALAQTPQILLLDEATSNLDINHQIEIMELLKELNRTQGLTVVAIMHDLNLASQYCETIYMMKDGSVFTHGDPTTVLTPTNIRAVYGAHVRVRHDSVYKRPVVYLLPGRTESDPFVLKVHLIGGGGSATPYMQYLINKGHKVSLGVLNEYDMDWEFAKEVGVEIIEEAAFSPISDSTHQRHLKHTQDVDCIVVMDVPIGVGNLRNLEAAEAGLRRGTPVLIMKATEIEQRDFTQGKATQIYKRLLSEGALCFSNHQELHDLLKEVGQFPKGRILT